MFYQNYIQEPEINHHAELFTVKTAEGYYIVCDDLKCKFKDGPLSKTYALIRGREHADSYS